jgi:protein-tyrosine phosphatase
MEDALALLRGAYDAGSRTVVATPHVIKRYPTTPEQIHEGVEALRAAGSPVDLIAGAEVAHEMALELPDETLRQLTLGDSSCILLESALSPSVGPVFERAFESLRERGYRVLLAHPERAPAFIDRPMRLRALVEQGALCSITAGAFSGRFGQGPRWFALELMRDGLVHTVDSDAHNLLGRPPGLREGLLDAAETLPFVAQRAGWYMKRAPAAILADQPLPTS